MSQAISEHSTTMPALAAGEVGRRLALQRRKAVRAAQRVRKLRHKAFAEIERLLAFLDATGGYSASRPRWRAKSRQPGSKIEELAQTDELTGVLNRRYIMRALNEEMVRAQRSAVPCSIAIIDLDFFKRINDSFGHPTGDEVLRGFAITLAANMREVDKLGRQGGEEFLLILPVTTKD